MAEVWFTADTHFGHGSIIDYCGRPFVDAQEMRERLIENWNSYVGPSDEVWHLGDFSIGLDDSAIRNILKDLNGRKRLVLGNHDERTMAARPSAFKGEIGLWDEILPGYVDCTIRGQKMTLCHFAMETWYNERYGAWMLHGHSHGRLRHAVRGKWGTYQLLRMDVGVDPVARDLSMSRTEEPGIPQAVDYRPISLPEIAEKMRAIRFEQREATKDA